MGKKVFVTTKFRVSALHHWVEADNYLKYLHRHLFHFTVWLEVFHDDRDVEFIQLKGELEEFTRRTIAEFGKEFSCEMLADTICRWLEKAYPGRDCKAWVEEDGENGAFVIWE